MASSPDSLRSLLGLEEVSRTLLASLVGRLPYTAIGLLLILRVRDLGGGYAEGGLAAGGFAVGLAAVSPFVGRLVDLRGQRAVLIPAALLCSVPLLAIAALPGSPPLGLLVVLAAAAGMTHPPLSGATRALWPDLVPPERRHAIYALESAGVELTFMLGPLVLVGTLAAAASPALALVVCVALLLGGTIAFALAPSSRRWRPAGAARTPAGALASPGILALLAACACMGSSFGAIEIATTAHAEAHGGRALVGPLLAAWALGSLIGGVVVARRPPPADPLRRLIVLLGATACADAVAAAAPDPVTLGPALLLAGACIAPAFSTLYAMVADVARTGTLTESYAWLTTGITAGAAAGSALGGALVDAMSTHATMGGAAGMVVLAAAITSACVRMPAGGAAGPQPQEMTLPMSSGRAGRAKR